VTGAGDDAQDVGVNQRGLEHEERESKAGLQPASKSREIQNEHGGFWVQAPGGFRTSQQ
jgi:hypothetical protein